MTGKIRNQRIIVDASGVHPLSEEEHWKLVDECYEDLLLADDPDDPLYGGLKECWELISEIQQVTNDRGANCRSSTFPLSTLFYYVEMGMYPPPELLLALADCWETYQSAYGAMTLEEAFLGRPKQKSGPYAKRRGNGLKKMRMSWEFSRLIRDGKSRTEAAEIVSDMVGGKPDADSILRMFRGWGGTFAKRPEK